MTVYKVLGFVNIALVVVVTSQYWVRKLNQWFFHQKGEGYTKLMKVLRALHKPAAVALLIVILAHGWLALGRFTLHTGVVAGIAFFVTALFGLLFYLLHKKGLLQWHRALALTAVLLAVVHLLFPWLLSGF